MKLKNILLTGLALSALTACNDFLDVDAPSKQTNESIFTKPSEINTALNNIYVQALSGDTYGNSFYGGMMLNSDVDFTSNGSENATGNAIQRFDVNVNNSTVSKAWKQLYKGIETANNFIYNLEKSEIYQKGDEDIVQMMGEAKVLRSMFYYDLIWYFGDVPFTFTPSIETNNYVIPVTDREEIQKSLIADLLEIAPRMKSTTECTVERASREAAYAMIARIALQAGGYSLHPDKSNAKNYGTMSRPSNYQEYYKIAADACGEIIAAGTHQLKLPFNEVFIEECNYRVINNDDPIFELPFAFKVSGNVGYAQGPTGNVYEGTSTGINVWGKSGGSSRLSAFFRFTFDKSDQRRDFVNGLWYYDYDGTPRLRSGTFYGAHNNKWSKFWATINTDPLSEGSTGINFPYIRYADVLLMFAEAENEINGPTAEAQEALKTVRRRAFAGADQADMVDAYVAAAASSKEDFLNAVLDERKWEFAGENMRWRDLVRNNKYAEVIYWAFLRMYGVAESAGGGGSDFLEPASLFDGVPADLPTSAFYNQVPNPKNINIYPNTTLDIFEFYQKEGDEDNCLYVNVQNPGSSWLQADFFNWYNDGAGAPRNECLYSFMGYIMANQSSNFTINNNGTYETMPWPLTSASQLPVVRYIMPYPNNGTYETMPWPLTSASQLPVVRYIMPYPSEAIQRAGGVYQNYYGY